MAVASPCVEVCRIDPIAGVCEGCWRTLDEIAAWSTLGDAGKNAVLAQVPARRAARAPTMKHLDFWFDPVSPYAYLAFERLPEALAGLSYSVAYRPIVFAALLKHHAHKGPAEIEPKRAWTFRQVHWLAHRHGIELETPARHPFNPLTLSRLAWACAPMNGTPNRYVCEQILRHVWQGGSDAEDADRSTALRAALAPPVDAGSDAVKLRLRQATDEAVVKGLFGVPTVAVDDRLFWGLDALDMVRGYLTGDAWFAADHWQREGTPTAGVVRR